MMMMTSVLAAIVVSLLTCTSGSGITNRVGMARKQGHVKKHGSSISSSGGVQQPDVSLQDDACWLDFSFSHPSRTAQSINDIRISQSSCGHFTGRWLDAPPPMEVGSLGSHRNVVITTFETADKYENAAGGNFAFILMRWTTYHGYELRFGDGYNSSKIPKLIIGRAGYFIKPLLIEQAFQDAATSVMFLDSDAFILHGSYGIRHFQTTYLPPAAPNGDDTVSLIWQWGSQWVNSGAMIFFRTKQTANILAKWWEFGALSEFHDWPADQPALMAATLAVLAPNQEHSVMGCMRQKQNASARNLCMHETMSKSSMHVQDLSGVLSIPTPEMLDLLSSQVVPGKEPLRLQCTCNPGQIPDFFAGCTSMKSLMVHVGSPFFDQKWHLARFGTYLAKAVDPAVRLSVLWNTSDSDSDPWFRSGYVPDVHTLK